MQLPYIDDRRMALYGKVTVFSKFGNSILKITFSTQLQHALCALTLFSVGIWWLLDSQDVSCNR